MEYSPLEIIDLTNSGLKTHGPMKSIQGMVIHHTGDADVKALIKTLKEKESSVQFAIDTNGKVYQLVPEKQWASHVNSRRTGTGTGGKKLDKYGNSNLEGVEILGAKNEKDVRPQQIAAAEQLVYERSKKYKYDPKTSVFGHGELDSNREKDEGMTTVNAIRNGSLSKFENQQTDSQTLSPGNTPAQQNSQQGQQNNAQTLSSGKTPTQQNNTQTLSPGNKATELSTQQSQQNNPQTLSSGNKPAEQDKQSNSQTNNNIQR